MICRDELTGAVDLKPSELAGAVLPDLRERALVLGLRVSVLRLASKAAGGA